MFADNCYQTSLCLHPYWCHILLLHKPTTISRARLLHYGHDLVLLMAKTRERSYTLYHCMCLHIGLNNMTFCVLIGLMALRMAIKLQSFLHQFSYEKPLSYGVEM